MIREFYKTKKVAGYLQLPYLLWLLAALYLAIGVWILN
jgi:tryptophan-rich sensory protein